MFPCFFSLEDPNYPDSPDIEFIQPVHAAPRTGERLTFFGRPEVPGNIYEVRQVINTVGVTKDGADMHAITVIAVRLT